MILTFKRPLIMTEKYLDIFQNQRNVGRMRYWRKGVSRYATSDVNIEIIGDKTYEINQQSFTIRDGNQWDIINNNQLVATVSGGRGLKKDRVDVHSTDHKTTFSIEARTFKTEGKITFNGEYIGKTKAKGFIFNTYYEVDIQELHITINPVLIAGIVYAFWSASNRR